VCIAVQLSWFSLCMLVGFPQRWWPRCRAGLLCSEEASGLLAARCVARSLAGRQAPGPLCRCLGNISVSNDITPFWSVVDNITPFDVTDKLLMYRWQLLLGVSSWCPCLDVSGPAISSQCLRAGYYLDVFSSCSEHWVNTQPSQSSNWGRRLALCASRHPLSVSHSCVWSQSWAQ
jgi:hypothetical protein